MLVMLALLLAPQPLCDISSHESSLTLRSEQQPSLLLFNGTIEPKQEEAAEDNGRARGMHRVIAAPDGIITVSCVKAGGGVTGTASDKQTRFIYFFFF